MYNPKNELTADQLSELSEDEMFAYLDAKATYLRQFTAPSLPPHLAKQYKSLNDKVNIKRWKKY